jgi:ArsR family transcriptional regulator, arsenate/arsenite/antimonite-responsive transcriptional repressor
MATRPDADVLTATPLEACTPAQELVAAEVAPTDDDLAGLAKALGHPARLRILRLLAERNTCIAREVVDELPLAQSTVSEHLRILRDAGLIQVSSVDGRSVCCLSPVGIARLKAGVAGL